MHSPTLRQSERRWGWDDKRWVNRTVREYAMNLLYTLVDESNNSGTQLTFEQGETKVIYVYFKYPTGAPCALPYNASNIQLQIQGTSGTITKDFSSGVAFLGAYMGFYVPLTSADTAAMPAGSNGVNMSVTITTPTAKQIIDFPKAFILVKPLVG